MIASGFEFSSSRRSPLRCRSSALRRTLPSTVFLIIGVHLSACLADEIESSVGRDGANASADVLTIQVLLNQVPLIAGGSEELLDPDGRIGPATIGAVSRFQRTQFGDADVDGRIDPGGRTLKRLNEIVDAQPLGDRVVRVALGERRFWRDGVRKETDPRVSHRLLMYWSVVNQHYTEKQFQDAEFQSTHPWSAVFVSWVMQRAGAGDRFTYSAAHRDYVAVAKRAQLANVPRALKAYPVNQATVTKGDIIVKRRGNGTATFDNIDNGELHPTHGDIVVSVSATEAISIGGNVSNSVKTTVTSLENGSLSDPLYFAVVKSE